jgi:sugar/nucleoside kinase (ribokinase family)
MVHGQTEPIVAVGTIGIDTVETPFGKAERVLGGSGTFFALGASLFAPVNLVSVVGDDFDETRWKALSRPNLDLKGVAVNPGDTFSWGGKYWEDVNHRDTTFTNLGVLASFDPVLPESYRSCGTVFLANVDPGIQLKVLDSLRNPRFVVTDTMNYWINGDPERLRRVIARSTVLIVNEDEARQLTGKLNLTAALEEIQALGPRIVVLKKGEHGAVMAAGNELFAIPGYPLKNVIDPTGAGDTFAGGFVGYLQRGGSFDNDSLRRAVVYGSALASFCCEDFSVNRLLTLTLADLEARVEEFRRLVNFL